MGCPFFLEKIDPMVKKVAEQLGITEVLEKYPYQMSGGQKVYADDPHHMDYQRVNVTLQQFDEFLSLYDIWDLIYL